MSHYQANRKAEAALNFQEPAKVQEKQPTLQELHDQITGLNAEIAGHIQEVKENPVLGEFLETAKSAGAMGAMGLLPKIPSILPELAPLVEAMKKNVDSGKKQHELTGEIIKRLGE